MFLKKLLQVGMVFLFIYPLPGATREIALTFDDAPMPDSSLMSADERTRKLIAALKSAQVRDAMFYVKADNLTADNTARLLQYTKAGYHLANHSFSHRSANDISADDYLADAYRAHLLIKDLPNFLTFHRFPFLHHGKDEKSIRYLQKELKQLGYRDGYVTVDNFDWYINSLINKAVEQNKTIDYDKARDFYVEHIIAGVEFYDAIAQRILKRSPRHLLLLHENDAAALFVDDLVAELRLRGWKIISPQKAYKDPIAGQIPHTTFYKQGRIAAIAASKGIPEIELRHISENIEYLDQTFKAKGVAR